MHLRNFFLMCDDVSNEMLATGIDEVIKEPMHADRGDVCSEKDAFGFKVAHHMKHPECFIIVDEVGGNVSQKFDGHAEGN